MPTEAVDTIDGADFFEKLFGGDEARRLQVRRVTRWVDRQEVCVVVRSIWLERQPIPILEHLCRTPCRAVTHKSVGATTVTGLARLGMGGWRYGYS